MQSSRHSSQLEQLSSCMGDLVQHQQTLHRLFGSFQQLADSAYQVSITRLINWSSLCRHSHASCKWRLSTALLHACPIVSVTGCNLSKHIAG